MVPEFRRGWAFSISSRWHAEATQVVVGGGTWKTFPSSPPRLSSAVYGNSATHSAGMSDVGGIPGYEGAL